MQKTRSASGTPSRFLENVQVDVPIKLFSGNQKKENGSTPKRKTAFDKLAEGTDALLDGATGRNKEDKKEEVLLLVDDNRH